MTQTEDNFSNFLKSAVLKQRTEKEMILEQMKRQSQLSYGIQQSYNTRPDIAPGGSPSLEDIEHAIRSESLTAEQVLDRYGQSLTEHQRSYFKALKLEKDLKEARKIIED